MARFPEKALARILNTSTDGTADSHRISRVLYRIHIALLYDVVACNEYAEECEYNRHPDGVTFWREKSAESTRRAEAVFALWRAW